LFTLWKTWQKNFSSVIGSTQTDLQALQYADATHRSTFFSNQARLQVQTRLNAIQQQTFVSPSLFSTTTGSMTTGTTTTVIPTSS